MRYFHLFLAYHPAFLHERLQELPYRVLRVVYPLSEQGNGQYSNKV
jgi:hypothetical protein